MSANSWVTITEPYVLPGTEFADVRISQARGTNWGIYAGEEPADESYWLFRLYKKDGFSARAQLPYGCYMIGDNNCPLPDELVKDEELEFCPVWQFAENNRIYGNMYELDKENKINKCTLSADSKDPKIQYSLIMICKDPDTGLYNRDISFFFGNAPAPESTETTEKIGGEEKETIAVTKPVYRTVEKEREVPDPYAKIKTVLFCVLGAVTLVCMLLFLRKKQFMFLIICLICLACALVIFFVLKKPAPEKYTVQELVGETIEYMEKEDIQEETSAADAQKKITTSIETNNTSEEEENTEVSYEGVLDAPSTKYSIDRSFTRQEELDYNREIATGKPPVPSETIDKMSEDERIAHYEKIFEIQDKISEEFGKFAMEQGCGMDDYYYRTLEGSLEFDEDSATFVIGRTSHGMNNFAPMCICKIDYSTRTVSILPFKEKEEESLPEYAESTEE